MPWAGLESREKAVTGNIKVDLNLPDRLELCSYPRLTAQLTDSGSAATAEPEHWESVSVRPGQSLDAIFRQQGFGAGTLHDIMSINAETRQLKNIRPGDLFEFQRYEDGSLKRMRYAIEEGNYLIVDYDRTTGVGESRSA